MNKAALREQFKGLLNRNDCSDSLADTFLDQALARIQRTLRVPAMEKSVTITFSSTTPDSFILPSDFLEFIDLYSHDDNVGNKLRQVPLGRFLETPNSVGSPQIYSRSGSVVNVKPTPSTSAIMTLLYYQEIPDFASDTDTNWLSTVAPELLVYGALSYSSDYFMDERKEAFEAVFAQIGSELVEQAIMLEFSGGSLQVQPTYSDY